MFLQKVSANDSRFKTLLFHDGMNIVTADRTQESEDNDSRNGAGKTSLARILRYLLGGNMTRGNPLKVEALKDFTFSADFTLPEGRFYVERPMHPMTRIVINEKEETIDTWKALVGRAYSLTEEISRPTLGELVSQTIRTDFSNPIKTDPHDSDWQDGVRLGYLLGLSPYKLNAVKSVKALKKNQKNIKKAIKDGALPGISLDEGTIRSKLINAEKQRDRMSNELKHFKVDEQYRDHQEKADELSQQIRDLNEEVLSLKKRKDGLEKAMKDNLNEKNRFDRDRESQVQQLYAEMKVVLPNAIFQRYEDVLAFNKSVVRNRKIFLDSELRSVLEQLEKDSNKIACLDTQRASIMEILNTGIALETFQKAQQKVQKLEDQIIRLKKELELATNLNANHIELKRKAADAQAELHNDINSQENRKREEDVISRFTELGNEIYRDREANLSIVDATDGQLSVTPSIIGDASAGIKQVEMFLLDMVFLTNAMELGRSPRFIFHDSRLFDSMDSRQLGSCLNIGARLADKIGFQYVVTVNSDNLRNAEGFENKEEYQVKPTLTDYGESGGLFGFRF